MTFKITLGRVLIALALLCYPWNLYLMRSSAGFYDNAQHGHDKMEQLQPRTWALAFSPVTAPVNTLAWLCQCTIPHLSQPDPEPEAYQIHIPQAKP